MLAELFEKARSAAAQRPADGPAAVVQLIVGDDAYVIDTRTNTPPHLVIRAERVQNADVEVSLDVATLVALLDGSLPPLRAWTQKLIRVKGDHKQLRALEWLSSVAGGKARSASSLGGATVQVRSANGDAGYGVYELQVTEEAACWTVWRRWSELKQLSTELSAEFGAGAPLQIHCTMHACRMHATCTPHVHVHRMCRYTACACTPHARRMCMYRHAVQPRAAFAQGARPPLVRQRRTAERAPSADAGFPLDRDAAAAGVASDEHRARTAACRSGLARWPPTVLGTHPFAQRGALSPLGCRRERL